MEPLWSPVVATGGNQWQIGSARKPQEQAKAAAVGCDQLPEAAHGKEGVDGSSPSEGLRKVPANRHFTVACVLNRRTHSGHICGTRNASRRLAAPSDTACGRASNSIAGERPA